MSQTSKGKRTKKAQVASWPYRPKNGLFQSRDVYIRMVLDMLRKDPALQLAVGQSSRFKYQSVYGRQDKMNRAVADWDRFQVISEVLFWILGEYAIKGWKVSMGKIGYLQATHLPPNPRSLNINWKKTNEYIKKNNLVMSTANMVFYEPQDYCTVRFYKNDSVAGSGKVTYSIANYSRNKTALKDRFVMALNEFPFLKNNYKTTDYDL